MSYVSQMAALDKLYAELPTITCRGECAESCGPIQMSGIEWQRIVKKLGYTPRGNPSTLACPMLTNGRCSVYAIRPMICRLWALVEEMACPWGCKPDPRYLTYREGLEFLAKAQIAGALSEEEAERERRKLAALRARSSEEIELAARVFHDHFHGDEA
jgi:Fe-S-cluster containining protein